MNTFWRTLHNNKGITLVEIMISVFVLAIGITGSLVTFTTAKSATRLARDTTTATAHAEYILEEMRALPTLDAITGNDWEAFIAGQNLNTLDDEVITVAIADDEADPLSITITVDWATNTRARDINFVTELTK